MLHSLLEVEIMTLPKDAGERKAIPIVRGCLDYFPDALCAVAEVSLAGNRQHHPDKPLHWDRTKSTDQADSLVRHLMERGALDSDGIRHTSKVAWRALALLQTEIEEERWSDYVERENLLQAEIEEEEERK
jgi:hypothetical protein